MASTAHDPGRRKLAGTGIAHSSAITLHTIGGTQIQCRRLWVGF